MGDYDDVGLFLALTPERVLDAVEAAGLSVQPISVALNSFENRVYQVMLADGTYVVAKFYRPGRWTEAQILEEHRFLDDLEAAEVPVVGVRRFPDGRSLRRAGEYYYCLYDCVGGRPVNEVHPEMVERLGMLVARIHSVGRKRKARHRLRLDAETYVRRGLRWLLRAKVLPRQLSDRYQVAARSLAGLADARLGGVPYQRIHGDFHIGNLLLRDGVLWVLDFDDMVDGPVVQDAWMVLPHSDGALDAYDVELFLQGYERFQPFDRRQLWLVEVLRGLRRVRYAAWLASRWADPIFPQTWPHYGEAGFWQAETSDLEAIVARIRAGAHDGGGRPERDEAPVITLTNRDYFWDLEE